jgi:ribose 5-phosphate isomerase B
MADHALPKTVYIASDHAGVDTKTMLSAYLTELGFEVEDLGPETADSVDYPDYAHKLGRTVVEDDAWGVLVCGSGIGMSIAANKVDGVRAALVHDAYTARMAHDHNCANVLVVGARVIGSEVMKSCIEAYVYAQFDPGDDGRHERRVEKLAP